MIPTIKKTKFTHFQCTPLVLNHYRLIHQIPTTSSTHCPFTLIHIANPITKLMNQSSFPKQLTLPTIHTPLTMQGSLQNHLMTLISSSHHPYNIFPFIMPPLNAYWLFDPSPNQMILIHELPFSIIPAFHHSSLFLTAPESSSRILGHV